MTAIPRNTARLPARLRLRPVVCNSFALIPPLLIFRKTSLFKGSARSLSLAGISSELIRTADHRPLFGGSPAQPRSIYLKRHTACRYLYPSREMSPSFVQDVSKL